MVVSVQIIFTCLAFAIASVLLKVSVKWARRVNPILLTIAFVFEMPIRPIYTE